MEGTDMTQILREEDVARVNAGPCTFRADDVKQSAEFRAEYAERSRLITPEMMPLEECDDGLIKHLMHERFGSAEMCVEAYMQFLAPNGASGKHRHMWEEIVFVLEGVLSAPHARKQAAEKRAQRAEAELAELRGSATWKVGRAALAVPRRARRLGRR